MNETPTQASRWRQAGRIPLWRYTEHERNFWGWHLNADRDGCDSLLKLVDMLSLDGTGHRTVEITAPTEAQLSVPNNWRGQAPWVAPDKLRIAIVDDAECWEFSPGLTPASLTLGSRWLPDLRKGIVGIPLGRGDYSIGGHKSGLPLWFWW